MVVCDNRMQNVINIITIAICTPHCVQGTCVSPDQCACDSGWTGLNCNTGNVNTLIYHNHY